LTKLDLYSGAEELRNSSFTTRISQTYTIHPPVDYVRGWPGEGATTAVEGRYDYRWCGIQQCCTQGFQAQVYRGLCIGVGGAALDSCFGQPSSPCGAG